MSNKVKVGNKKVEIEVDQNKVLDTIVKGIEHEMLKDVLVKPLEVTKVMKHITELVPTKEVDKETGLPKSDTKEYDKEVDSVFRKGIVLLLPVNYEGPLKPGDKITFPMKYSIDFDLFKDSVLVKPYDIISRLLD